MNVCIKCNPVQELINDPACREGMYCPLHGEDFTLEVQDRPDIWHDVPHETEDVK